MIDTPDGPPEGKIVYQGGVVPDPVVVVVERCFRCFSFVVGGGRGESSSLFVALRRLGYFTPGTSQS